ncbi:MAG: glycosyltransferase family 2 protein [Chloroflexota bacterium]
MKLSILIPAYNEQSSVEAVLRRVAAMDMASVGASADLEIIVVDDCSTDETTGILARLHGRPAESPGQGPPHTPLVSPGPAAATAPATPTAAATAIATAPPLPASQPAANHAQPRTRNSPPSPAIPGLRVIQHGHNQGKGAAIRTALAAATGDYVIIQDADFEYDPADIPRLLKPMIDGAARVVYGARPLDGAGGRWLLDFGNRALTVITNLLYGTRLHDMETCYKLLPTALLRSFELECSRFDMEPEITAKVTRSGYRIHEVPIAYHPRAGGKKLSARKDGLPALQALLRYRTWFPKTPPPLPPR